MKLTENTLIKYTLRDKNGEEIMATFTMQQIEGSSPSFYEQFKETLRDLEDDFDLDSSEIVDREIVGDGFAEVS